VSFYVAQDTAAGTQPFEGNALSASFGDVSLVNATQVPVQGYTLYSSTEKATSASRVLSLKLGNDLGEFLLDGVSVSTVPATTSTPEPSSLLMLGMSLIALPSLSRTRVARRVTNFV